MIKWHIMTNLEKLSALRERMKSDNIAAYIITSADPHISEYLPERYKNIEWISGFTGSAGTLVITADFAGLWTDSRYFVQASEQLNNSGFELVKLKNQGASEYAEWLSETLAQGDVIGFDGRLASIAIVQQIKNSVERKGIHVRTDVDLIDGIWEGRPDLPKEKAYLLSEEQTGKSIESKIVEVQDFLRKKAVDYHLISSLDDISWIFNIRGTDVKCNPVVLSFALFGPDKVELYIDDQKLSQGDLSTLANADVSVLPYADIEDALMSIPSNTAVFVDPKKNCYSYYALIPDTCQILKGINPSTHLKAIKNNVELAHTRFTMIKDGVALTRFFYWLEKNVGREVISETNIATKLKEFRSEQTGFVGESFDTIAGYKDHGALPHYKATAESDSLIQANGLLLVDSGGQYLTGTTDITRVVSLGDVTQEEKTDYTLVLKAMIDGSTTHFPVGTKGYQIDAITRKALWDHWRDYGHGTGHGVGFFLNVHEGPHVFNASNVDIPIDENMITSIEPGLYREGLYGIRIENLVASRLAETSPFGQFMKFETLTLCYIETSMIDKDLLERHHITWLNEYHENVYAKLSDMLNEEEKNWLRTKTIPI